jgi:hypothetical protein
MEQFLRNKKELCYIDRKKYVELSVFTKYLGYDSTQLTNINVLYYNDKCFISIELAEQLMKTVYNKDNPDVVQYHKEMGITDMQYSRGTKTLGTVKSTFDSFSSSMTNIGNNIGSAFTDPDTKNKKNTWSLSGLL